MLGVSWLWGPSPANWILTLLASKISPGDREELYQPELWALLWSKGFRNGLGTEYSIGHTGGQLNKGNACTSLFLKKNYLQPSISIPTWFYWVWWEQHPFLQTGLRRWPLEVLSRQCGMPVPKEWDKLSLFQQDGLLSNWNRITLLTLNI